MYLNKNVRRKFRDIYGQYSRPSIEFLIDIDEDQRAENYSEGR